MRLGKGLQLILLHSAWTKSRRGEENGVRFHETCFASGRISSDLWTPFPFPCPCVCDGGPSGGLCGLPVAGVAGSGLQKLELKGAGSAGCHAFGRVHGLCEVKS